MFLAAGHASGRWPCFWPLAMRRVRQWPATSRDSGPGPDKPVRPGIMFQGRTSLSGPAYRSRSGLFLKPLHFEAAYFHCRIHDDTGFFQCDFQLPFHRIHPGQVGQ